MIHVPAIVTYLDNLCLRPAIFCFSYIFLLKFHLQSLAPNKQILARFRKKKKGPTTEHLLLKVRKDFHSIDLKYNQS